MTVKECEIETSKAIVELRKMIEHLQKKNEQLENDKKELLGIIQGKDEVIKQAKEIIKGFTKWFTDHTESTDWKPIVERAEQFLNGEVKE